MFVQVSHVSESLHHSGSHCPNYQMQAVGPIAAVVILVCLAPIALAVLVAVFVRLYSC